MNNKKHIQVLALMGAILSLPLNKSDLTGDVNTDAQNANLIALKAGRAVKMTADGIALADADDANAIGVINSNAIQNMGGIQYNIASQAIDVISGGSLVRMYLEGSDDAKVGDAINIGANGVLATGGDATKSIGQVINVHNDGTVDILIKL